MGMFDRVDCKCPECGGIVELQSKAGDCILDHFSQDRVPTVIAADLSDEIEKCKHCNKLVRIIAQYIPKYTQVTLEVI